MCNRSPRMCILKGINFSRPVKYSKPVWAKLIAPQGHFRWARAGKWACETPDGEPVNDYNGFQRICLCPCGRDICAVWREKSALGYLSVAGKKRQLDVGSVENNSVPVFAVFVFFSWPIFLHFLCCSGSLWPQPVRYDLLREKNEKPLTSVSKCTEMI